MGSSKAARQQEQTAAIERLRQHLAPGAPVWTQVVHVARSGMSRAIVAIIKGTDGDPWDVSYLVAKALDRPIHRTRGGVVMGGVGMDMGFALVYDLSRALYPDPWECIGTEGSYAQRCPSSDHVNAPHESKAQHTDGGYALRHRTL